MLESGRSAWEVPDIQPYTAWQHSIVEEQLLYGNADAAGDRHLLSPQQESVTWEMALSATGVDASVLQTETLAAVLMDAHAIEQSWLLPLDEIEKHSSESSDTYLRVRQEVRRIWEEKGVLPATSLPRLGLELLRNNLDLLPEVLAFAGFDLFPDNALAGFEKLQQTSRGRILRPLSPAASPSVPFLQYEALEDEIHAAAQWSRMLLERGEEFIGIVFPGLDRNRTQVERVFSDVLAPATVVEGHDSETGLFELSLGTRCSDEPLMAAAMRALDLLRPVVPVDSVSAVLRSPFFLGAATHRSSRMQIELRLRRAGISEIRQGDLRNLLLQAESEDPLLAQLQGTAAVGEKQSARQWVRRADEMLRRFGWPGERSPASRQFQAQRRWERLLDEFSALDAVLPAMNTAEFLQRLGRTVSESVFQPETQHAPVQIMGILETAGLYFNHCLVIGMNEEQWPPPARVHPFLPHAIQRKYGVTEAVPERYLEQMRTVTRRVQALAPEVQFSCSRVEGDRDLLPSPLLRHLDLEITHVWRRTHARSLQLEHPASMEVRPEDAVPALRENEVVRGGVRVLTLQSACPFRAFAELRLHVQEPEIAEEGVRPLDRGNLLHKALEKFWEQVGSHAALTAMDERQLRDQIRSAIVVAERTDTSLRSAQYPSHVRETERSCLEQVVTEWLDLERTRSPFTVVGREETRIGTYGPLSLQLRIDRMDRLEDGSVLLIDYKTSQRRADAWLGARPAEPQLPMYTMTGDEDFSAMAFAVLKRGETALSGLSRSTDLVPQLQEADGWLQKREEGPQNWEALRENWKDVLTALADEFASGFAAVDPRDGAETCRYCSLASLCRVSERPRGESDE
jgi:probable DNA repair protein